MKNLLKKLKEELKGDSIHGIKKQEEGYNLTCWSGVERKKYIAYVINKKEVDEMDNILKEARELNISPLEYLNFSIEEVGKVYNYFI